MSNREILVFTAGLIFGLSSVVSAGPDSVNWDNLNLNYKTPKYLQKDDDQNQAQIVEQLPTYGDARLQLEEVRSSRTSISDSVPQYQSAVNNPPKDASAADLDAARGAQNIVTGRVNQLDKQAQQSTEQINSYFTGSQGAGFQLDPWGGYKSDSIKIEGQYDLTPNPNWTYSNAFEGGGSATYSANRSDYTQDYQGLELNLQKRFSNRWQLLANYRVDGGDGQSSDVVINPGRTYIGPPVQYSGVGFGTPFGSDFSKWTEEDWEDFEDWMDYMDWLDEMDEMYGEDYEGEGLRIGDKLIRLEPDVARTFRQSLVVQEGQQPIYGSDKTDRAAVFYNPAANANAFNGGKIHYNSPTIAGFSLGTSYGNAEGIGESYGVGGTIVSCGKVKKVCTLAIYDNNGVLLGTVQKKDLELDPMKTARLLYLADQSSRESFSSTMHNLNVARCQALPQKVPTIDLSGLRSSLNDGFNLRDGHGGSSGTIDPPILNACLPQGGLGRTNIDFEPKGVMGLQLGQLPSDIIHAADVLNNSISCSSSGFLNEHCFDPFTGCPTVHTIEPAYDRYVLKEKAAPLMTPNDPLYMEGGGKKKSKVKEAMKNKVKQGLAFGIAGSIGLSGPTEEEGPEMNDQWGLQAIGYLPKSDPDSAWNVIDGSKKNVLVAVIDSGLYLEHPDGPEYVWTNPNETPGNDIDDDHNGYVDDIHGWNFINNNNDLTDEKGHGTFVAGIIAAKANNGIGIAGINPGAVIMPLKVADQDGVANSMNIYRAIRYAVNHGAQVINISLGARGVSKMEQMAINYANTMGVFVVIASGNGGEYLEGFGPSSSRHAMAVGSIDISGERSTVSNWGPNNGILAPGELVYSLRSVDSLRKGELKNEDDLYHKLSGTSFSAPMVAATASLLLAKDPTLTNRQLEDILSSSADEMYDDGWDEKAGAGVLNATKALRLDPKKASNVKVNSVKVNKNDKNKIDSVDVFATVRGTDFKSFTVELGKGKRAGRFAQVAGPYFVEANTDWVARIGQDDLRGSDEWVVRINAVKNDGQAVYAQSYFELE